MFGRNKSDEIDAEVDCREINPNKIVCNLSVEEDGKSREAEVTAELDERENRFRFSYSGDKYLIKNAKDVLEGSNL